MIPIFSEHAWKTELDALPVSDLTKETIAKAVKAFHSAGKAPVISEGDFERITNEIFFFELGKKRLLLSRKKSGALILSPQPR